ncbi:hypothetical protein NITUZ_60009 [Candidatus Nitrosotenuis uzonensis]|uniref:Uncharacterized protein n=1 Tax=Candidatus Nitrosotenuis uzonensis TaxID=1407055 RepID=V6AV95_9ARCH|nr:hypothetical protein NITUZ_60009 [Candidatus Nitrosotenuis uzonensis]
MNVWIQVDMACRTGKIAVPLSVCIITTNVYDPQR